MPEIRFNHMELTFPRGALDDVTRKEIADFYGEMFGWSGFEFEDCFGAIIRVAGTKKPGIWGAGRWRFSGCLTWPQFAENRHGVLGPAGPGF